MLEKLESVALPNAELTGKTPADVINKIVPYFFAVAGILLILYLIIGGLSLMTSQGDPKKIQEAQGKITGALVGIGIMLLAYILTIVLGKFFGVSLLQSI